MRIQSTRLPMRDDCTVDEFYKVIVQWLKSCPQTNEIGIDFERSEKKCPLHIADLYCTVDTMESKRGEIEYDLFKLRHEFYGQTWETEAIFENRNGEKSVIIHIECFGDTTSIDNIPPMRRALIAAFVESGCLKQTEIPITSRPIEATDQNRDWLVRAINGKLDAPLPVVFATKCFNSAGYEIDVEDVAKKLAGIAYVIIEIENDYAFNLKESTDGKNPYNGYVGVYFPNGRRTAKTFYPGKGVAGKVMGEVSRFVTAQVGSDAPSWSMIHSKEVAAVAEERGEMLDAFEDENGTLEEKNRALRKRVGDLMRDNAALAAQLDAMREALAAGGGDPLIEKADEGELHPDEQHDMIVAILQSALRNEPEGTRMYDLLLAVLAANPLRGTGQKRDEIIKNIFSRGEALSKRDIAQLENLGFEIVSDNKHYKVTYKGHDKYWFSVSKTPSDSASGGKNLVSQVLNRISIYR